MLLNPVMQSKIHGETEKAQTEQILQFAVVWWARV